jgi:RNA polymerase sigma-70 factor (ECF subfamily)
MTELNAASRFNEIYDSTNKPTLVFITSKCKHTADISDIFQETYLELYQVLLRRGTDYVTNDKALILRIAKRKIARYYSFLERLRIFTSISKTNDEGEEVELAIFEADTFLTEDFAVNQIMLETTWQFIREKPEDVKKVFYLFYSAGLTIPQIAQTLAISESGVKNKLYRTLKELRNLLK